MTLNYEGWCRRIDLAFRTRFPYLNTRLFKIDEYNFKLYVINDLDNFSTICKIFENEIKYLTTPIRLVSSIPKSFACEIKSISDTEIPSNFEGIPFTLNQLLIHLASVHPEAKISKLEEDHSKRQILIELTNGVSTVVKSALEETVNALKCPYTFKISINGTKSSTIKVEDEVFNIAPSQSRLSLQCQFLERDEKLWYDNINRIYDGSYKKSDLYFINTSKNSCLINFSIFQNANLRNHLLLYDVIYCILPLAENMESFLTDQKINRTEFINLTKKGRIKIINIQPEIRLDYGFLNEIYQENQSSIISRRALSALCAIDLVELNQSYILSDPELKTYIYPFISEVAKLTNIDIETISNFLLWPQKALRASLDRLNQSGPMGIASYGVNKAILDVLPSHHKQKYEFEFTVNSNPIHLAHALDATYFPFFINGEKYSDHPYALMMGNILNFYKGANYSNIAEKVNLKEMKIIENPTLSMISIFDVNDYIPIQEFEEEVSSSVIRKNMGSLFSELCLLNEVDRNERIESFNKEVDKALSRKRVTKHALDLGEDTAGLVIPFFGTGKKIISNSTNLAKNKYPVIQEISDFIEEKMTKSNLQERQISLLSKINRVARLKRQYN